MTRSKKPSNLLKLTIQQGNQQEVLQQDLAQARINQLLGCESLMYLGYYIEQFQTHRLASSHKRDPADFLYQLIYNTETPRETIAKFRRFLTASQGVNQQWEQRQRAIGTCDHTECPPYERVSGSVPSIRSEIQLHQLEHEKIRMELHHLESQLEQAQIRDTMIVPVRSESELLKEKQQIESTLKSYRPEDLELLEAFQSLQTLDPLIPEASITTMTRQIHQYQAIRSILDPLEIPYDAAIMKQHRLAWETLEQQRQSYEQRLAIQRQLEEDQMALDQLPADSDPWTVQAHHHGVVECGKCHATLIRSNTAVLPVLPSEVDLSKPLTNHAQRRNQLLAKIQKAERLISSCHESPVTIPLELEAFRSLPEWVPVPTVTLEHLQQCGHYHRLKKQVTSKPSVDVAALKSQLETIQQLLHQHQAWLPYRSVPSTQSLREKQKILQGQLSSVEISLSDLQQQLVQAEVYEQHRNCEEQRLVAQQKQASQSTLEAAAWALREAQSLYYQMIHQCVADLNTVLLDLCNRLYKENIQIQLLWQDAADDMVNDTLKVKAMVDGIEDTLDSLSGGQRKRAALILALASHHYRPFPLFLMDELLDGVESDKQEACMEAIQSTLPHDCIAIVIGHTNLESYSDYHCAL